MKKTYINYRNLKEETRVDRNVEILDEKENGVQYYISKFKKKGSDKLSYEKTAFIDYKKCIYFDIETVEIGELIVDNDDLIDNIKEQEEKTKFFQEKGIKSRLNTTTANYLKQFAFVIPVYYKTIISKIEKLENFYIKDGEKYLEYLEIKKFDEYIAVCYYNVNSFNCREFLFNFLVDYLASERKATKIIGFNSNKFDTLIFKDLEEEKNITLQLQNKDKAIEIIFNKTKTKKIHFIDLRQMSFNFGCPNLKSLGEFCKFEKLENDRALSKDEFIDYNIRDCEILFEFVKVLNKTYKIFDSNFSRYARNYNHKFMFEEALKGVNYVSTSRTINAFEIAGGRTEAYNCYVKNAHYVDINSLYSSVRVNLDTVIPKITGDKAKFELNKIEHFEDFYNLIFSFQSIFFEYAMKEKFFNYVDLAKEYDKLLKDSFFIGKFKIKGYREEIPEYFRDRLNFFFPFNTVKNGKRIFSLVENNIYDIGYYMIMFLGFFDFEIVELYQMPKGKDIFADLVNNLYEERKIEKAKPNGGLQLLKKLLLNTSWGIFATKNGNNKKIVNKEEIDRLNTLDKKFIAENTFIEKGDYIFKIKKHGEDYFKVPINQKQKWATNSLPSLAKNIVDNGHFVMYSFMINLVFFEDKNYQIYYTDTDSFFINDILLKKLEEENFINPDKLGLLKNEYPNKTIEEAYFLAPKTYAYKLVSEEETKIVKVLKGVRDWKGVIYQQSLNENFRVFEKVALNPYQEQKRFLIDNEFLNGFGYGISTELIEQYEKAKQLK